MYGTYGTYYTYVIMYGDHVDPSSEWFDFNYNWKRKTFSAKLKMLHKPVLYMREGTHEVEKVPDCEITTFFVRYDTCIPTIPELIDSEPSNLVRWGVYLTQEGCIFCIKSRSDGISIRDDCEYQIELINHIPYNAVPYGSFAYNGDVVHDLGFNFLKL